MTSTRGRVALVAAVAVVAVLALVVGLRTIGFAAAHRSVSEQGHSTGATLPTAHRSAAPAPVAVDHGTAENAAGDATLIRHGRYRYVVARADTPLSISARFHVCATDVIDGEPLAKQNAVLVPGEVLTLELDPSSVWADGTVHCPVL